MNIDASASAFKIKDCDHSFDFGPSSQSVGMVTVSLVPLVSMVIGMVILVAGVGVLMSLVGIGLGSQVSMVSLSSMVNVVSMASLVSVVASVKHIKSDNWYSDQ